MDSRTNPGGVLRSRTIDLTSGTVPEKYSARNAKHSHARPLISASETSRAAIQSTGGTSSAEAMVVEIPLAIERGRP